jgi:hypothetical protein
MMAEVHPRQPLFMWPGFLWREAGLPAMMITLLLGCGAPQQVPADDPVVEAAPAIDTVAAKITAPGPVEEEPDREADDGHHVGALETYRYWAGEDPDADMQVLNGEYWASAHWSKEYTLYLELRFPRAKDFVMGKRFKRSMEQRVIHGAPDWFDPPADYEVWEGNLGSLYFLHPKKGHIYIFERQL